MTHYEKLDSILNSYLYLFRLELDKNEKVYTMTFTKVCQAQIKDVEDWEIDFLKQRLLSDEYIERGKHRQDVDYRISSKGIAFNQNGGYTEHRENASLRKKIEKETLRKFRFDKIAFWISVFSLLVSIVTILMIKK